jgi:hypothetical protein
LKVWCGNSAAVTVRGGVSSRSTHKAGSKVRRSLSGREQCRVDLVFILAVVALYAATRALVAACARLRSLE